MKIELTREQYTLLINSATTYLRLLANKTNSQRHQNDLEELLKIQRAVPDGVEKDYVLTIGNIEFEFQMPDSDEEAFKLALEYADTAAGNTLNCPLLQTKIEYESTQSEETV